MSSLYYYETHLHTTQASACARVSGAEHVRIYKNLGYTGICVTDHFFNGNSCVPKHLPWEERIDLFCLGYEQAKEEGDKLGLSVFFGWEAGYSGTEFLVLGLDKVWLKKHPDMLSWSIEEQYRKVHEDGGLIIHAHPFRIRPYISEVRLYPEYVDAVEVLNLGNNNSKFDQQARDYASKHKLPMTAGTDAHGLEKAHTGISFQHKIENINEFIDEILTGKCELINSL